MARTARQRTPGGGPQSARTTGTVAYLQRVRAACQAGDFAGAARSTCRARTQPFARSRKQPLAALLGNEARTDDG